MYYWQYNLTRMYYWHYILTRMYYWHYNLTRMYYWHYNLTRMYYWHYNLTHMYIDTISWHACTIDTITWHVSLLDTIDLRHFRFGYWQAGNSKLYKSILCKLYNMHKRWNICNQCVINFKYQIVFIQNTKLHSNRTAFFNLLRNLTCNVYWDLL